MQIKLFGALSKISWAEEIPPNTGNAEEEIHMYICAWMYYQSALIAPPCHIHRAEQGFKKVRHT